MDRMMHETYDDDNAVHEEEGTRENLRSVLVT